MRTRLRPETVMLIRQIGIGVLIFTFFALILTGVWYGTRIKDLGITEITVTGGYTISHDEVEEKVRTALAGTYLGLIPRNFSYLYPEDDIKNEVLNIPKLKNPVVDKISRQEISITIDEYLPKALWCQDLEAGHCLFVDENGYAFSEAPHLVGSAFVRYKTLASEPALGQTLTNSQQLETVKQTVELLLRELSFPVLIVELDAIGDEFYILSGGSEIKASKQFTPEQTIENLKAVLSAPDFVDLKPGDFSYIDLRFGNKVFVNDVDPNLVATTTLATTTSSSTDEGLE